MIDAPVPIEEEIARLENAIAECETALLTFVSVEETQRQSQDLQSRKEQLTALLAEWEELSQALQGAS